MTKEEIFQITKNADSNHVGDLALAALDFLGLKGSDAEGRNAHAAAIGGIVCEVGQYNEASKEIKAQIDAYKAAKEPLTEVKKTSGRTKAKSK